MKNINIDFVLKFLFFQILIILIAIIVIEIFLRNTKFHSLIKYYPLMNGYYEKDDEIEKFHHIIIIGSLNE